MSKNFRIFLHHSDEIPTFSSIKLTNNYCHRTDRARERTLFIINVYKLGLT